MADGTGPTVAETVTGAQGNTYELAQLAGRWVEMRHDCGKRVTFVNPRPDRVAWYADSHRCGPLGWQGE